MKSLFNHELNKYVYVVTVVRKIFIFLKIKKYHKIHYNLMELAYVFLIQKQERLNEIILGFKNKQNILKIKNKELNRVFIKSKESFYYMSYFIKLNTYYQNLIGFLSNAMKQRKIKHHVILPNDMTISKGAKSFQKKLWCLIFYSSTHKEMMNDIIEVKKFKLMLYEFLVIMKLSTNFIFKDKQSNTVFNWVKYYHDINSLSINKIQMETLTLENKYLNK